MAILELHKQADYSTGERLPDGAWPLSHVELAQPAPEVWTFTQNFVDQAIAEGWAEWRGAPFAFEVVPDPRGQFAAFGPQKLTHPGSELVLHLWHKNDDGSQGEAVDLVYRVTAGQVPAGFREEVTESPEYPEGIRVEHAIRVALVSQEG